MPSLNDNKIKRFLLLGDSGSGKTTFINYLTNYFEGETNFDEIIKDPSRVKIAVPCKYWCDNVLKKYMNRSSEANIDDSTRSQTNECFEYKFKCRFGNQCLSFIDTPGINDTAGMQNDIANLKKIVKAVTNEENVNGIILLINGTSSRLSMSIANFISVLKSFLPTTMIQNLTVVLTNCEEESCNFDVDKCLNKFFKVEKSYTMQNQLMRWDKKVEKLTKGSRFYTTSLSSWNSSIETIELIIDELIEMPNLDTKSFKINEKTVETLNEHVIKHIKYLLELVDKLNQLTTQKESIKQAQSAMNENSIHEKKLKIEVIPFYDSELNVDKSENNKTKKKKLNKKEKKSTKLIEKKKKIGKKCAEILSTFFLSFFFLFSA